MKIIRDDDNESCLLEFNLDSWASIGKQLGWLSQAQRRALYPHNFPATSPTIPADGRMTVRMTTESDQTFAIYIRKADGEEGKPAPEELLCKLTSYRDALVVQQLIRDMADRIADDRERRAALARSLKGSERR